MTYPCDEKKKTIFFFFPFLFSITDLFKIRVCLTFWQLFSASKRELKKMMKDENESESQDSRKNERENGIEMTESNRKSEESASDTSQSSDRQARESYERVDEEDEDYFQVKYSETIAGKLFFFKIYKTPKNYLLTRKKSITD